MTRNIGVDLHWNCFTAAVLGQDGRFRSKEWKIAELGKFLKTLKATDRIAVEMTSNVRFFHDAVAPLVAEVVIVNTRQFRVISDSVKKTDKNDAETLARFLSKDMLPTVQLKPKRLSQLSSLTHARDALVKQRTMLKNMVGNRFSSAGETIGRERMSSEKGLREMESKSQKLLDVTSALEVKVFIRQIRALNESIAEFEQTIESEGSQLCGYEELISIKGIGPLSATIFLTVIGDVRRFASESHLFSYFGIVPSVSDSNETERRGRITKRGSKLGRTTLVQCGLIAKKYSPYLAEYYNRLKKHKKGGKAKIALARKLLGIIYHTLKNGWVFEDFPAFRLKGGANPSRKRHGLRKEGVAS